MSAFVWLSSTGRDRKSTSGYVFTLAGAVVNFAEAVESGAVLLEYVNTSGNVADLLTKPFQRMLHEYYTRGMGVDDVGNCLQAASQTF